MVCVVVAACGSGAEMRPRGRRNSVRIDALDGRISALEGRKDAVLSGGPTKPLEQRVHDLEEQVKAQAAQVKELTTKLQALQMLGATPPTSTPAAAPAP